MPYTDILGTAKIKATDTQATTTTTTYPKEDLGTVRFVYDTDRSSMVRIKWVKNQGATTLTVGYPVVSAPAVAANTYHVSVPSTTTGLYFAGVCLSAIPLNGFGWIATEGCVKAYLMGGTALPIYGSYTISASVAAGGAIRLQTIAADNFFVARPSTIDWQGLASVSGIIDRPDRCGYSFAANIASTTILTTVYINALIR